MKNKNFRKLKYVPGNPQNAGFCTIYPTASGPDLRPNFFRLASVSILHLLFQNSLLLLKVLKALLTLQVCDNIGRLCIFIMWVLQFRVMVMVFNATFNNISEIVSTCTKNLYNRMTKTTCFLQKDEKGRDRIKTHYQCS